MLDPLSPRFSLAPVMGGGEVGWRLVQIMVPSLQLFQVLVVDQPLAPEVLEKTKVGPAPLKRLAVLDVFESDVVHAHIPGRPPVIVGVSEFAQWALHRSGGFFEHEVAQAVLLPLVHAVRSVRAAQEPESALVHGGSTVIQRPLEDAIVLLQERHAGELASQAGTDRGLGRGGVGIVVERGRVRRSVGGVVDAGGRHGRGVAADGAGVRAGRALSERGRRAFGG